MAKCRLPKDEQFRPIVAISQDDRMKADKEQRITDHAARVAREMQAEQYKLASFRG